MGLSRTQVRFLVIFLTVIVHMIYLSSISIPSRKTFSKIREFFSISSDKNIFLLETRLDTENMSLTSRMACAIESAARANPERSVFLLYVSFERLKELKPSSIIDAVSSYPNVYFDFVNLTKISVGCPLEEFIRSKKWAESSYPIEHLADATRLLVLWKYGGVYIDSDVIVRRSFDTVPSNFVCKQDILTFANGVMGFNHEKDGQELLERLMKEFAETYDPSNFASNGPALITRFIKQLCGKTNIARIMIMKRCKGFSFLKTQECYAVGYPESMNLMTVDSGVANEVMHRVNKSLVVHFWNHQTKYDILETKSVAPYVKLAKQFCPKVLNASGDFF